MNKTSPAVLFEALKHFDKGEVGAVVVLLIDKDGNPVVLADEKNIQSFGLCSYGAEEIRNYIANITNSRRIRQELDENE